MIGFVAAAMLSVLGMAPTGAGAATGDHPGCKGIDQAMSKASAKGKTALAVVSEKFGCGSTVPDPVDPAACPAGAPELGRWAYAGSLSPEVDAYGYHYWIPAAGGGSTIPGWTNTVPGSAAVVIGDAGGFYWSEAVAGSVTSIVLVSMTGERVVVTDPPDPISQNLLSDRTGINLVTFCGAAA